jgi:predicted signal transduction protein with EAL and GGDEF domain
MSDASVGRPGAEPAERNPVQPPDTQAVAKAVRDPARLAALRGARLLDTGPEESFDRLTRLAVELLDVPVSLVSLVDEDRQYFKSAVGLRNPLASPRETSLLRSICQQVVAADAPVVIDDTRALEALRDSGAPDGMGVSAYAGVPLRGPEGAVYGAFCVIDSKERRWSLREIDLVEQLGSAATGELELRNRLAHALLHDALTGLPQRNGFAAYAEESLRASQTLPVAALAVGITALSVAHVELGSVFRDKMLVGIAIRLKERLGDAVVARLGDEQFAVLCGRVTGEREALGWADAVREALAEPLEISGQFVPVFPHIGIALSDPTDSAEDLIDGAAEALRGAAERPHQVHAVGRPERRANAIERLRMENALRLAILRRALRVFFQPKVRLSDRSLIGFEALLRWEDPEFGSVPPLTFVPIAEASGLIAPLGQFVLVEACRQAGEWRRDFPDLDLSMAVNLSPRRMQITDVATLVEEALEQTGLPPERLTIEITEGVLLHPSEDQITQLRRIGALGVALELDDFGTGYSSLSYLAQLPICALKIDRSFISSLEHERTRTIVASIIALGAALGLDLTAEGIETETQLDQIRAMGCSDCVGQGYLFGRPQPAELVRELLSAAATPADPEGASATFSM